jgi:STE24 endopeptidase
MPARLAGAARRDAGLDADGLLSPEALLAARARAAALVVPAAVAAAAGLRLATAVAGAWWWLAASALLAVALVSAAWAAPAVLRRVTRARPLDRPDLAARLVAIARRAGAPVAGIDEVPTTSRSITALVAGIGRSRRVFLSSEIVRDWRADEVDVVVAHEIAHHAHGDVVRTVLLDALLAAASLGTADAVLRRLAPAGSWHGPADLASLPLVALVAGAVWILLTPIRHAESRRQERLADARALVMTGGADALRSALRRLRERRLAEERPSRLTRWLFHPHPTVTERLAMADAYEPARAGSRFEVRR